MNIAEKPIAAIIGRLTSTGDGIHMIANTYKRASGSALTCTARRSWFMPPKEQCR